MAGRVLSRAEAVTVLLFVVAPSSLDNAIKATARVALRVWRRGKYHEEDLCEAGVRKAREAVRRDGGSLP